MKKKLKFNFIQRTLLYGFSGLSGLTIDGLSFTLISLVNPKIPLIITNLISYNLGTITSFKLNKKITFKSDTHKLSFFRFYLTSILGMASSTIALLIFTKYGFSLIFSKAFATIMAVILQYFINFSFSLVKDSYYEKTY